MKNDNNNSDLPQVRTPDLSEIPKYVEWLHIIDELLDDESKEYANFTLSGIRDWVKVNKHITSTQIQAVINIRDAEDNDSNYKDSYY